MAPVLSPMLARSTPTLSSRLNPRFIIGTDRREYLRTADAGLEIRLRVDAGKRLIGVAFLKTTSAAPEGLGPAGWPLASYTYAGDRDSAMGVDSIQISGPYNGNTPESTPSRRSVFVCRPSGSHDEENCAKTILGRLARRAYVEPAERKVREVGRLA